MKNRKLTVLCAGAYGIGNAGDDLPLICLREGMCRRLPDHQLNFRALSRHPDPWEEKTYGVTMVQNPEYPSGTEAAGRWFRGFNPGDDPAIFETLRREIREADLLVLGAGNALLDQTIDLFRGPVPLMSVYGFLAALYHTPLMIYGMSVGPLRTEWGKDLSRGLLASARVVTVRDHSSVAQISCLFEECPETAPTVHLLPDPAMAAKLPPAGRGQEILDSENLKLPSDKTLIAVGLRELSRPLGSMENKRLEDAVVEMMDQLSSEAAFLLVPQSTYREDDDRDLARRLVLRTQAHCLLIENRQHPTDLLALYGLAHVTLAGRLHAAVFSTLASVPVVGIDYLPKVSGFLENISGAGRVVSIKDLTAEKLVIELRSLLDISATEREKFEGKIKDLTELAREHTRLAVEQGLDL